MANNVYLHTVTKIEELDPLPDIQEEALRDDPLHGYVSLANKGLPMQPHFKRSMEANFAEGPEHIMIQRAIEKDESGVEKVVGFACWYFGEGFTKRDESVQKEGNEDKTKAQKAAAEQAVAEAAPPALPATDPTKMAEEAKKVIEEQPAHSAADDAQKEREKRRAERAEKFIHGVFEPYGKYYDEFARGKPHIYLRQMYVLPSHQGRGISSKLMRWGMEKADKSQLFCFLIATSRGHTVYLRYGFKDEIVIKMQMPDMDSDDDTKFLETEYRNYIMLRKLIAKE